MGRVFLKGPYAHMTHILGIEALDSKMWENMDLCYLLGLLKHIEYSRLTGYIYIYIGTRL